MGWTVQCECGNTFTLTDDVEHSERLRRLRSEGWLVQQENVSTMSHPDLWLVRYTCPDCAGSQCVTADHDWQSDGVAAILALVEELRVLNARLRQHSFTSL